MIIYKNKTLLFIGDSITDCGRSYPVDKGNGLGGGYVNLVNDQLQSNYPDLNIEILNTGISGNTILDLERRWGRDVLDLKADLVSIMIGINDVWQQVEAPYFFDQINPGIFEKVYRKLIESIAGKINGIILMTPYYIELNKTDPMRKMMNEFGEIVKNLSDEFNTIFVDTQKGFDNYLTRHSSNTLSDDKVHPNLKGHKIIADSFLETVGFKANN